MINEVCCTVRYQKGKRVTIDPEGDGSAPKDDHQLSLMTRINLQKPGKKPDVVVHICISQICIKLVCQLYMYGEFNSRQDKLVMLEAGIV